MCCLSSLQLMKLVHTKQTGGDTVIDSVHLHLTDEWTGLSLHTWPAHPGHGYQAGLEQSKLGCSMRKLS